MTAFKTLVKTETKGRTIDNANIASNLNKTCRTRNRKMYIRTIIKKDKYYE